MEKGGATLGDTPVTFEPNTHTPSAHPYAHTAAQSVVRVLRASEWPSEPYVAIATLCLTPALLVCISAVC